METVNIIDFGAVSDGKTLCTAAIQKAIDSLVEGGTVLVPPGVFVSGTLRLEDNITLYLSSGAVLRATADMKDYREIGFYHNEMKETVSFLYAISKSNISIKGNGIIDLNGSCFMDFEAVVPMGVELERLTAQQIEECVVMHGERPNQPIFFHNCERVTVQDVCIKDSPCWTLTFSDCRDIKITGITIDNHPRVPNNDGIHLSASQDVLITGCRLICGDDCIAMTCITDWDGVTKNIIVADCILSARSAAVRMGHLESKVENVLVHHCTITNTNRGFAIFAGDNGYVSNAMISDIILQTHLYAGAWWGKGEPAVICAANSKGMISDIRFRNIQGESENPFLIAGEKGNVSDISICDSRFKVKKGENHVLYSDFFELDPNCRMKKLPEYSDWMYSVGVKNLQLERVQAETE